MTDEKIRENRARRLLSRKGYVLAKCRDRNPLSPAYGLYSIHEADGLMAVTRGVNAYSESLEEVERLAAELAPCWGSAAAQAA